MAAVERSGSGQDGIPSKRVVDFDRQSKFDELEKEMEQLEHEIANLQKEFQGDRGYMPEYTTNDRAQTAGPVCFTCMEYKKGGALFPCGHTYCWKCISKLKHGQGPCPRCQKRFWLTVPV